MLTGPFSGFLSNQTLLLLLHSLFPVVWESLALIIIIISSFLNCLQHPAFPISVYEALSYLPSALGQQEEDQWSAADEELTCVLGLSAIVLPKTDPGFSFFLTTLTRRSTAALRVERVSVLLLLHSRLFPQIL